MREQVKGDRVDRWLYRLMFRAIIILCCISIFNLMCRSNNELIALKLILMTSFVLHELEAACSKLLHVTRTLSADWGYNCTDFSLSSNTKVSTVVQSNCCCQPRSKNLGSTWLDRIKSCSKCIQGMWRSVSKIIFIKILWEH